MALDRMPGPPNITYFCSILDATFENLQDDLQVAEKAGECRYCVYDYQFIGKDGAREKLVFLFW